MFSICSGKTIAVRGGEERQGLDHIGPEGQGGYFEFYSKCSDKPLRVFKMGELTGTVWKKV